MPMRVASARAEKLSENSLKTLHHSQYEGTAYDTKISPLVVLGLALALEAVDSVHVVCLVVSTVQEELVRSQPLVSVEEQSNLS